MKEPKEITVCPICNSIDIVPYIGFETGWQYQCKSCGYIGALTKKLNIKEIKHKLKKKNERK